MRRLLAKAVLSVGVLVLAGGGMAASASVASASTGCNVPIVYNSNDQTTNVTTGASSSSSCDGTVTDGSTPDAPIPPTATAAPIVPTSSTSLAFTGADIWQTVVLAVVLIGAGLVVVRLSRRRHQLS